MPLSILPGMELNRVYKCGCVCLTLAPKEMEQQLCPACLIKENVKINSNKPAQ